MNQERILIVDGEPKNVRLLYQLLTDAGYKVLSANKGMKAVQMAAKEQPDLMIVEIDLPGEMNGYEVVRRVREFSDIPLIFLSSRDIADDMLHGFELGGDDYITKPYHAKLLLARLRVALRRSSQKKMTSEESRVICGDLVIDLPRRQVTVEGREVYLTETEYNLLLELARHNNQVLFHEHLLTAVWGHSYRNEVEYLRSYIHLLRRKLESNPSNPKLIVSKPGLGYMLVSEH